MLIALTCFRGNAWSQTSAAEFDVTSAECASLSGDGLPVAFVRLLFHAATAAGDVDFNDRESRRLMSIECRGGELIGLTYVGQLTEHGQLTERARLPLDRLSYAETTVELPGVSGKELVDEFISTVNEGLNNGTHFRIAFFLEVNEARAGLGDSGEMYYIGLVDGTRGMIALARVILNDEEQVTSVTLGGAGIRYIFCRTAPPGLPRETSERAVLSCSSSNMLRDQPG